SAIMDGMSSGSHRSRRDFLGLPAAAVVPAAVVPACDAGSPGSAHAAPTSQHIARRRTLRENALRGDPRWRIRHLGAPDAIMGYAGQDSVLPGEPVTLYVSTTARSFRVKAFRMGWYSGDLARLVWRSGTVAGHRQGKHVLVKPTNTVQTRWGPSVTVP